MDKLETFTLTELMQDYVPLPCPKNAPSLSLSQIIQIEPRITWVLITLKPSRRNDKWFSQYDSAKRKLSELVGWQAEQYILRTSDAYDVVMDYVIAKLDGKGDKYTNV